MWPRPNVSSTSTTAPASHRRTSPSLASNSTHPLSHTQPRRVPREADRRGREPRGQIDRRDPGKEFLWHKRDFDVGKVRLSTLICIDTKTLHDPSPDLPRFRQAGPYEK